MRRITGLIMAGMLTACGAGESGDAAPDPVALVALAPAQQGAVSETMALYGAVETGAMGKHVLASPVEGSVVAIEAPIGTPVRAGQVIVQLAPSPTARLDLTRASSDAALAEAALARAIRLRGDGLTSDADVETARAAARSSGATRASLSTRTRGLTLRAPTDGYVESIAFAPGDIVPAGGAVAAISGSGTLRARFGVDPAQASRIRPGATLAVTGPGGVSFTTAVQSVNPVVDPATRLAALFVTIPAGLKIGSNSALSAVLSLDGSDGAALTIPYAALLDDGGQPYVFVVAGGVAHRHDVEVGAVSGGRVAITRGVKPGEKVVTQGGTALEDGMKVRTK
jgi:RND family efflux transporter MFP subunit